jgi:hypothetical protein
MTAENAKQQRRERLQRLELLFLRSPISLAEDFFDHVLRSAESYTQKWHYLRENRVRAGLVKDWEDWPFSGEIFALEYRSER